MSLSRSEHMARVKGVDTKPEMILRSALWGRGLRYRLHRRTHGSRPDLVFISAEVAVFVDGCFWHGCPDHYSKPRSSGEFWAKKLRDNVNRDMRQTNRLECEGWTVIRVWEHEIVEDLASVVDLIAVAVAGEDFTRRADWRVVQVEPADRSRAPEDHEKRSILKLREPEEKRVEVGPRRTASSPTR